MKARGAVGGRHTQPCLGKDSLHIKKGDIQHKRKKKYHEEHLSTLEKCDGERFASDFFNGGKHHVSSVQNRDRQKVENGEIYINEDHKPKKLFKSNFGKYTEVIYDTHRTTHVSKFHIRLWADQTGEGKIHVLYTPYNQGERIWVGCDGLKFGRKSN